MSREFNEGDPQPFTQPACPVDDGADNNSSEGGRMPQRERPQKHDNLVDPSKVAGAK